MVCPRDYDDDDAGDDGDGDAASEVPGRALGRESEIAIGWGLDERAAMI
jgi:hypothetical protein